MKFAGLMLLWAGLASAQGLAVRNEASGARLEAVVAAGAGALTLRVDGRETPFVVEADGPAEVVVVIDGVNASAEEMLRAEVALESWLGGQGARLRTPVSVLWVLPGKAEAGSLGVGGASVHRLPATRDGVELVGAVRAYAAGRVRRQDGGVGEAERVRESLAALSFVAAAEAEEVGAKVVVWMSPGWPYLERAGRSASLFGTVVAMSEQVQRAGMVLEMVDPAGVVSGDRPGAEEAYLLGSRGGVGANMHPPEVHATVTREMWREFVRPVRRAEEADPNDLLLEVLAVQSGGQVLAGSNDVAGELGRAAGDALRVATLRVRLEDGGLEQYRAVEVRGALRVRAGFYGR